jgi:hypothetical protein
MTAHEDFIPWPELLEQLSLLQAAAADENVVAIKAVLRVCVHGFHAQQDFAIN